MRWNKWSIKGKNKQFEVRTIMVLKHHVVPKMGADYFLFCYEVIRVFELIGFC